MAFSSPMFSALLSQTSACRCTRPLPWCACVGSLREPSWNSSRRWTCKTLYAAALVRAAQNVLRPGLASPTAAITVLFVLHREEAADNLGNAVRQVERLEGCQVQAPSEQLLHLILQELVVRCGPLEEEDAGEDDLPQEIHETVVYAIPVQRREAVARHEHPHRDPCAQVLLAPEGRPEVQDVGARRWSCSRAAGTVASPGNCVSC